MNQRRRRPVRKRDGTFNYSADNYCVKYDETTGVCPDGDEWVNLKSKIVTFVYFVIYIHKEVKKFSIVCGVTYVHIYALRL